MNTSVLFYVIIGILLLQFAIETVLDLLNARKFKDPVPEELRDVFEQDEYRRSQEYKQANFKFGLISGIVSLGVTIAFLIFGGFDWIDTLARGITEHPIGLALLFFGMIFIGSDIISTPFAYYQTFVIEEKFGFNKTTRKLFITDKLKGWLMGALLGGGMLAIVIWFFTKVGSDFWIYAWVVITVFTVFINLFYTRLIVPLFNKQTPLEDGSLRDKIQSYARKVGFELQHIFVIDGSKRSTKANAYFSGFGKTKRITLYDTLIEDLEEDEIVSVLAHEVGHYKKQHIIYNLLASILITGLTLFILSLFINNPEVSAAIGVETPSFHAALIGFGLLYSPISQITGLLMNLLSRKFEYQADDFAKSTFAPQPLISSLKKLSGKSLSNLTPHPAYVFMHYSHPTLQDRIRNLRA
ncbi:M48 family metallopeptidase [Lentiprolixibacter aurantiacus]|uniref:M48 family metallopeptidase n=1 Tax=Lentiprolixibacter aurantiacus TaxID=2993939 RepID=A0AAE3MM84_9FLAO|nr:M48 family metallopeptidase [Lentiprolixibacter aurantiacus]MCX2720430.1 M48 family metallopeptidase [Lentiprolixibacter aurantiacus]